MCTQLIKICSILFFMQHIQSIDSSFFIKYFLENTETSKWIQSEITELSKLPPKSNTPLEKRTEKVTEKVTIECSDHVDTSKRKPKKNFSKIKKQKSKKGENPKFFCEFCNKGLACKASLYNHENYFCEKLIRQGKIEYLYCSYKKCKHKSMRLCDLKKHMEVYHDA